MKLGFLDHPRVQATVSVLCSVFGNGIWDLQKILTAQIYTNMALHNNLLSMSLALVADVAAASRCIHQLLWQLKYCDSAIIIT